MMRIPIVRAFVGYAWGLLLFLALASLAKAQTAYVGTPSFCRNAEACSFALQPSGAIVSFATTLYVLIAHASHTSNS